ncbi:hypothetical protein Tco_0975170 [Tanacetum coccineum]|uniref:Uncharacterized protein n=1 Tax=Tanacetum coccineum TaxID=301880 RepID=A0ABQ5EDY4_9ASTR
MLPVTILRYARDNFSEFDPKNFMRSGGDVQDDMESEEEVEVVFDESTNLRTLIELSTERPLGAYNLGVATPRALVYVGLMTCWDAKSWYMISGDAKSDGRPAAVPQGGGTGGRVSREGRRMREPKRRKVKPTGEPEGQGNDQGVEVNEGVDGVP